MSITNGYCTLKQLQDYLGRSVKGPWEDKAGMLERMIDAASRYIDQYTGKVYYTKSVTAEVIDRYTRVSDSGIIITSLRYTDDILILPAPIISITSIVEDNITLTSGADYYIYTKSSIIDRTTSWSYGRQNIKITGSFGYASVPDHINNVCVMIAASFSGLDSKVFVDEIGASQAMMTNSIPAKILKILDRERTPNV